MNKDISQLYDPFSGGKMSVCENGNIRAEGCAQYPVIGPIPKFVSSDNYADDFGRQWNKYHNTQLDSYTVTTAAKDRLTRCMNGYLLNIKAKLVLEAASGTGRFTEVLFGHGAVVHSFDYSSAVGANAENIGKSNNLTLEQADIRHMPFQNVKYDCVICLGVLQHTPNTEESIKQLWQKVRPGGSLIIDHYRFTWGKIFPPPISGAQELYRLFILRLPKKYLMGIVTKIVDFFFPIQWRYRGSALVSRILVRVFPVCFHYKSGFGLESRQMVYE